MIHERGLKTVLAWVECPFLAAVYPLSIMDDAALPMMLGVYVTLGTFAFTRPADPVRESQPDRLYGLVEPGARRRHCR